MHCTNLYEWCTGDTQFDQDLESDKWLRLDQPTFIVNITYITPFVPTLACPLTFSFSILSMWERLVLVNCCYNSNLL